jgi:hypothetical protein
MNKTPKRRKSTKRLIDVKEKHAWQRIICHHLQKKKKVQEGLQAIPLCHVSPFLHVAKAGPT